MTRRGSAVALVLVVFAVLADPSRASEPCQEHMIRADGEAQSSLGENPSDAEIIHAVAALMRLRLHLPLREAARAYICVDQAALVAGLIRIAEMKSSDAWDMGPLAAGVATPAGLFLQGDYLAKTNLVERAGVIAHELAHLSQQKLAELAWGQTPLWFLEGHAEWVQFRVLDLLGLRPYATSSINVAGLVVLSPVSIERFPDLSALTGRTYWTRAANQLGWAPTYGQAFLAVDWLVERYGAARLVEYLGPGPSDPRARWSKAFPISYRDFVDEFHARLHRRTPSAFDLPSAASSWSAP